MKQETTRRAVHLDWSHSTRSDSILTASQPSTGWYMRSCTGFCWHEKMSCAMFPYFNATLHTEIHGLPCKWSVDGRIVQIWSRWNPKVSHRSNVKISNAGQTETRLICVSGKEILSALSWHVRVNDYQYLTQYGLLIEAEQIKDLYIYLLSYLQETTRRCGPKIWYWFGLRGLSWISSSKFLRFFNSSQHSPNHKFQCNINVNGKRRCRYNQKSN